MKTNPPMTLMDAVLNGFDCDGRSDIQVGASVHRSVLAFLSLKLNASWKSFEELTLWDLTEADGAHKQAYVDAGTVILMLARELGVALPDAVADPEPEGVVSP